MWDGWSSYGQGACLNSRNRRIICVIAPELTALHDKQAAVLAYKLINIKKRRRLERRQFPGAELNVRRCYRGVMPGVMPSVGADELAPPFTPLPVVMLVPVLMPAAEFNPPLFEAAP